MGRPKNIFKGNIEEFKNIDEDFENNSEIEIKNELKSFLSFGELFVKLEELGYKIKRKTLEDLICSGDIPFYQFVGDDEFLFSLKEVIDWAKKNLILKNPGRKIPLIVTIKLKGDENKNNKIPSDLGLVDHSLEYFDMPIIQIGVYFLIRNNKTVYVGQSVNIHNRVLEHIKDKIFDRVFVLPLLRSELDSVEAFFINYLHPEYNSLIPKKPDEYDEIFFKYIKNK